MNKFALVTLAALPGQGSGVAAYRAPEVWKAPEVVDEDVSDLTIPQTNPQTMTYGAQRAGKAREWKWYEEQIGQERAPIVLPANTTITGISANILTTEIAAGPDEGDEEDQSEGPPTDDPYFEVKAAFAKFGREALEVKFRDDEPWHAWKGSKPAWNAPASNYRVAEKYRENI